MTRCSVLECKNNSSTKNLQRSGISYHRFPKDPHIKEKWITATGRINWMPMKSSCICSEHFQENDILITIKGYRYIDQHVVPTKKIMSYQDKKMTSTSSKLNILEPEAGPSSAEPPTKKPCIEIVLVPVIEIDHLQKDSVSIIQPADEITMKSHEACVTNNSPSTSLYSTPSKMKLGRMLRWTKNTITKKDLKIKRLQAQNRRLKRRLENMNQILKTLEEKFV